MKYLKLIIPSLALSFAISLILNRNSAMGMDYLSIAIPFGILLSIGFYLINRMSANSLFGHLGDYFGVDINSERSASPIVQPLTNTYQIFMIKAPSK